jgi:hypothetical protein
MATNDRVISEQQNGKDVRYFTGICLKRTTKITKNVVRIIGLEAEN